MFRWLSTKLPQTLGAQDHHIGGCDSLCEARSCTPSRCIALIRLSDRRELSRFWTGLLRPWAGPPTKGRGVGDPAEISDSER